MRVIPAASIVVLLFCSLSPLCVLAGGPLRFNGSGPIGWDTTSPIEYVVDRGPLGSLDATQAQGLVDQAFKVWSDVPASRLQFQNGGLLPSDVQDSISYLALESDDASPNIVVFDSSGDIIAELAGPQNRFRILGWANPLPSVSRDSIVRFYALMNGLFATSADTFLSTMVHEFGHAVGLDHSQIHASFASNGIQGDDQFIPTMFPTNTDDDTHLGSLNPDDEAWASMLYPKEPEFSQTYGQLKGRLVRGSGGAPVLGANVLVFEKNNRLLQQYSCVSDWLGQKTGEFVIPVKPGEYQIRVEPILPRFTAGSSVGPWSDTATSPSFVDPVSVSDFADEIEVSVGNSVNVGVLTLSE